MVQGIRCAYDGHTQFLRIRLLFEQYPQPMWVIDATSWAFLAVNQAVAKAILLKLGCRVELAGICKSELTDRIYLCASIG